jgi:hypothetical protein
MSIRCNEISGDWCHRLVWWRRCRRCVGWEGSSPGTRGHRLFYMSVILWLEYWKVSSGDSRRLDRYPPISVFFAQILSPSNSRIGKGFYKRNQGIWSASFRKMTNYMLCSRELKLASLRQFRRSGFQRCRTDMAGIVVQRVARIATEDNDRSCRNLHWDFSFAKNHTGRNCEMKKDLT